MNLIGTLCFVVALVVGTRASEVVKDIDQRQMNMYTVICQNEVHGTQLADPFDCAQFIHCHHGRAEVKKCSPGTIYDNMLQVCNWEYQVQCNTDIGLPPIDNGPIRCYGYNGIYFIAHTSDCEHYFICANGVSFEHHCAPGIHWDYLQNQCDRPESATCYVKADNNMNETFTELPTPPTPTTTVELEEPEPEVPSCSNGEKFISCKSDCSKYYICIGGSPFVMSCPAGYYWNSDRSQCDVKEMARCNNVTPLSDEP